MGVLFDCRGIDPADDMTVRAAINQIGAAMSCVTQHERRRAVVSSSLTASLTERHCKAVIDSAIVTGFHAVACRSSRARRGNDRPRRVDCGAPAPHHARVLAHRR